MNSRCNCTCGVHAVVPERPRGPGTGMYVAERNKAGSSSHKRDGRLLCGQCEQKLAHVVSILTTDTVCRCV